ncbi:hypothetical protein [Streptomyces sp. NPDC051704]|uniref:hypothetical protein n=1 Tax=Streptomyces sp. NPDC051704 TaxID=3365671 RepID=UPI0037BC0662
MGRNGPHQGFQLGDVLRVSCPPAQGRVVDVSRFDVAVEWPWAEIDPQSQFRWNGRRAFVVPADYPDEALSEDGADTIHLDSAAPVTIGLVSRG